MLFTVDAMRLYVRFGVAITDLALPASGRFRQIAK
jgi:hypothetical protein